MPAGICRLQEVGYVLKKENSFTGEEEEKKGAGRALHRRKRSREIVLTCLKPGLWFETGKNP